MRGVRGSILRFKATVLQVHIIEFSIMEPEAIKVGRGAEEKKPHSNQ